MIVTVTSIGISINHCVVKMLEDHVNVRKQTPVSCFVKFPPCVLVRGGVCLSRGGRREACECK